MSKIHDHGSQCGSDCGGCDCGDSAAVAGSLPYKGWQVVFGALGIFVWPLALAIGGSLIWSESPGGQLAGALAGLGIGMCLAWLAGLFICRRAKKERL